MVNGSPGREGVIVQGRGNGDTGGLLAILNETGELGLQLEVDEYGNDQGPHTQSGAAAASAMYFMLAKQYACLWPRNRNHLIEGSQLCGKEPGIGHWA